ncbi:ArsR/SmtB family transcription factor [Dongia sp.]|uniref:ArsR/SmtB family transcription factor n=1 Tax=Dongia sp. TaxID=1977262 RepID=UPI0035B48FCA
MRIGPDISRVASLIGDPARANILEALMAGKALTSSELAVEAGITAATVSSHLGKLQEAGLIAVQAQGRHRYWRLAHHEVAEMLEALTGIAARTGHLRTRTGPKEPALRKARICYDHLAGDYGVLLYEALKKRKVFTAAEDGLQLSKAGSRFCDEFGIDLVALEQSRRPLCRDCLDWSVRKSHLAGSLGAALLTRIQALGWARREKAGRVIAFTPPGERAFLKMFGAN